MISASFVLKSSSSSPQLLTGEMVRSGIKLAVVITTSIRYALRIGSLRATTKSVLSA